LLCAVAFVSILGNTTITGLTHYRTEIIETIYQNGKPCNGDLQTIRKRADELVNVGLGIADAAHIAFAEVNAEYFISCDDRLLNRSKRESVNVIVMTPVEFCVQENLV